MRSLPLLLWTCACVDLREQEDLSPLYDPGSPYDVSEPVEFTDVNYDFVGERPIEELPVPGDFETLFAAEDLPSGNGCEGWISSDDLPAEITGIVTILPRFYYKTGGCQPNPDIDSDEKYYGSYFIQDSTAGYFVLGDSKVAHFDMGNRVTLKVRAIKESFDQTMIAVHDVEEVSLDTEPIYYEQAVGPLGAEHVARVMRIEATVATEMSTFGEVYLDAEDGTRYKMGLDAELARRGVYYPPGTTLTVTGPVLFSFDEYTIVVMRIGQIQEM